MIRPVHYLLLSVLLWALGLLVAIARRDRAVVTLGVACSFQAVTLAVAALTGGFQDWGGHVLTLVTVSALPPLVGLALGRLPPSERH
jgi:NADH:ubiquinone oxidoreductase subunit K